MTTDKTTKTKRIAKNTVILYIRMALVLVVSLYTSRIVLKALGVEDFGLYNVVGGVVALFSFLRTSMEKATQRFLNVEMARGDAKSLNTVFSVGVSIHIAIVILVILLTETVGLWFLNEYIQIPPGREVAANWVYQTTIISLCFTILSVPYSAEVISHEDMSFYAVVSVAEAILKLVIAFLILFNNGDRLIIYGLMMMSISIINWLLYYLFCRKKYEESKYHFILDRKVFREMFSFTSWTLLGQMAIIGTNQGNNILVNMFHSVTANAAMTIGSQVNAAVASLSANFQTAFNPQITKSYAEGDHDYLRFLIYTTSKISFFLLFLVSLPIMFNINWALHIWLGEVPVYANIFSILFLCNGIINALSTPLNFCVMATGKIKWFQIVTTIVYLSDLVIVYALFAMGLPPATVMYVKVGIIAIVLFVRLYYAQCELPNITLKSYSKDVLLPLTLCSIACVAITAVLLNFTSSLSARFGMTALAFIFSVGISYLIGLSSSERAMVKKLVMKVIHR